MDPSKVMGQLKGIVQTIEQKSGMNAILFVVAIISLPSLVLYALTNNILFVCFASVPVVFFVIIFFLAFRTDKNFLRSERFVYDMKQLDILGEKGKEYKENQIVELPAISDPAATPKKEIKSGDKK